ncbi:MAG: 5'-nucleotidase C-terminal domain-containing protein [Pseudomonadota bacterium]
MTEKNGLLHSGRADSRFQHVSGLTVEADSSKLPGERIVSASMGGTALDPAAKYRVSTNGLIASGRRGYEVMKEDTVILGETDGELVSNIVTKHVETQGEISPKAEGRLVIR